MNGTVRRSEKIIVYIDILGFKNFIKDSNEELLDHFFGRIDFISKESTICFKSSLEKKVAHTAYGIKEKLDIYPAEIYNLQEITLNLFSDTIVFTYENNLDGLYAAMVKISCMQLLMLEEFHLLMRGVITVGNIIQYKHMITGLGLGNAYESEKKLEYPMIILEKDQWPENTLSSFFESNFLSKWDDVFFINYLGWLNGQIDNDYKIKLTDSVIKCYSLLCEEYNKLPVDLRAKMIKKIDWFINYTSKFDIDLLKVCSPDAII